jgi:aminoglycoside 3-N-acetyltransferase
MNSKLGFREVVNGLKNLGVSHQYPVLAHVDPGIIKEVKGGAKTLLGALLTAADNLVLPAFTSGTQVIPETGPANNALQYGSGSESNLQAEIFYEELRADEPYLEMSEQLRHYPNAMRSPHPILSFVGLGLNSALAGQNNQQPYAPIKSLMNMDSMVLLIGVDQTRNFSLHYAEFLAGRKQFTRWALTKVGVLECNPFPGCPDGFTKIERQIEKYKIQLSLADSLWQAYSLQQLIEVALAMLKKDPFALLCNRLKCERCNAVRQSITG